MRSLPELSYRTPHAESAFRRVEQGLLRAEVALALIEQVSPINYSEQCALCEESMSAGVVQLPVFTYVKSQARARSKGALSEIDLARRALDHVLSDASSDERTFAVATLLSERAVELMTECELLSAFAREDRKEALDPEVIELGHRRFSFTEGEQDVADKLAEEWLKNAFRPSLAVPSIAEEESVPLLSWFSERARREVPELRVIERELATVAAVGGDTLYVRRGATARLVEAERLWQHEVLGHALPRLRAKQHAAPFQIGTSQCAEDEEGRALLLEERSGTLTDERRFNLVIRHRVARAVRGGRVNLETELGELLSEAASPRVLASSLCRALRGGGLAREAIYLPAYLRVKQALDAQPELEEWQKGGRISVRGARILAQICGQP